MAKKTDSVRKKKGKAKTKPIKKRKTKKNNIKIDKSIFWAAAVGILISLGIIIYKLFFDY